MGKTCKVNSLNGKDMMVIKQLLTHENRLVHMQCFSKFDPLIECRPITKCVDPAFKDWLSPKAFVLSGSRWGGGGGGEEGMVSKRGGKGPM